MKEEEHKKRHIELHKNLDELFADFITNNHGSKNTTSPIIELIEWSYKQTQNLDHSSIR